MGVIFMGYFPIYSEYKVNKKIGHTSLKYFIQGNRNRFLHF